MARPELRAAATLQRKAHVPDGDRTPSRDEVADWIEEHVINGERDWSQWTISEVAAEIGCSRQHVSNVLDGYFDPAGARRGSDFFREVADDALGDASGEGYAAGFADGFKEGILFVRENPELFE